MTESYFFILGLMLGGTVGVVSMSLFQIDRINEDISRKEKNKK